MGVAFTGYLFHRSNVCLVQNLPIDFLTPGKYQPRKQIIEANLRELAVLIKVHGIIQLLLVRKVGDNRYEIVAGERRWQAAKIVGLTNVPSIIRNVEDKVALAFSVVENVQRADLNPIEEAIVLLGLEKSF